MSDVVGKFAVANPGHEREALDVLRSDLREAFGECELVEERIERDEEAVTRRLVLGGHGPSEIEGAVAAMRRSGGVFVEVLVKVADAMVVPNVVIGVRERDPEPDGRPS